MAKVQLALKLTAVIVLVNLIVPSNCFYSSFCETEKCERNERLERTENESLRKQSRKILDERRGLPDDAQNKYIRDKGRIEESFRREFDEDRRDLNRDMRGQHDNRENERQERIENRDTRRENTERDSRRENARLERIENRDNQREMKTVDFNREANIFEMKPSKMNSISDNAWSFAQGLLIGFVILKLAQQSTNAEEKQKSFKNIWENMMKTLSIK